LFITPLEYKISRLGKQDTTIRVVQNQTVEFYSIPMTGTVTGITVDPNNWIINKSNVQKDPNLQPPNPVGFNQQEPLQAIAIGPNPAHNELLLTNPAGLQGSVELYDVTGKLVHAAALSSQTRIPLDAIERGVYLVHVVDNSGSAFIVQKIIKD
jgi:hypothetical protein